MSADLRPLSPHLQIYRLPLTAILSIGHRIAGVALGLAAIAISALLVSAATGEAAYHRVHAILASVPGHVLIWLCVFGFHFHLCNGIRHLIWDTGRALDLKSVDRGAAAVLVAAALLTLA